MLQALQQSYFNMAAGFNFKRRQRLDSFFSIVEPLPKKYYDLRPRKETKPDVEQSVFKDPEPIEELFNEVVESKQETKSNPGKSGRRKKD